MFKERKRFVRKVAAINVVNRLEKFLYVLFEM